MEMTTPNPVHTSAQQASADLFGETAFALTIELKGRLTRDAEVRHKPVGDGQHCRPVLCLEIEPLNQAGHHYHAEQVYTEATLDLATERARALRKGTYLSLKTPWAGALEILPHVQTIHTEG